MDDSIRRGNTHPKMEKTEAESTSLDSSTEVANGDEDNTTMQSKPSDASVSSL